MSSKKAIKIITFILIIAAIFNTIQNVIMPEFGAEQGLRSGFQYEEENSIDVLFLGSSNMYHTINPLVLYEEKGIRGFDFGSSSQSLNMSYMYLKEALKTQSPKVVCLEVLCARANFNEELYEAGLRWGFTYFPSGFNKFVRLYDQLNEKIDAEYLSYVFPLIRYKARWNELEKSDFQEKTMLDYRKGCSMQKQITPVSYGEAYWQEIEWEIAESNVESLNQIKELCDKNGIELVLFKSPNTTLWKNVYSEKIGEYAEQNELPFIDYNLMIDELGIDLNTCFKDSGHLNYYGSIFTTKHMAEYLSVNYDFEDYRNGEENSWDRACEEWHRREANSELANAGDLDTFLENLNTTNYTVSFLITGDFDDVQRKKMLDYFNINVASNVEGGIVVNGTSVALLERGTAYSWHDSFAEQDYAIEGAPSVSEDNVASYISTFYVNGENCTVVSRGINIVVYDNVLKEFVSVAGFDADAEYEKVSKSVSDVNKW